MITKEMKKKLFENPDVTSVGYGFKYTAGVKTSVRCVIVGVKKKKPRSAIRPVLVIPRAIDGQMTDIQEKNIVAFSFTQKMRPCPPGYSIGHTAITAGTLGAYVRHGDSDWWILSNNHVLAASNQGKVNDAIIQPGKADGGFSQNDRYAWLREFVTINWDENGGSGCNLFKRAMVALKMIRAIEQPSPNLVDAALALPVNQGYVKRMYPGLGVIADGFVDLELGDRVAKAGRTTEVTYGDVEGVDTMVRVQYSGGTATFDDQIEIRSPGGEEFSAGGDSGSAILKGSKIGGLLFAGSSGSDPVTIANRIGHVVDLLGVSL